MRRQKDLPPKSCGVCSKTFQPYRSSSRLCSKPCRSKASQERVKKFHAENPGASMLYKSRSSPEAKERNRIAQRRWEAENRYGITLEEWDAIIDRFNGQCALCGSTDRVGLDHDHRTGRVRGLLCFQHNTAIGKLGDNEEELWNAIVYMLSAMERPDWNTFFLWVARSVSLRGDCIRRQVGSVLVDSNHIIRGVGFNGSIPGGPSCKKGECPRCLSDVPSGTSYEGCVEIHSEDNCLRNSNINFGDKFETDTYTMYITCEPCYLCKKLMFDAGITNVIWPEGNLTLVPRL